MSNFVYKKAVYEIAHNQIDWINDTIKVMLVDGSYIPSRDDEVVDTGKPKSPLSAELHTYGYEKGHGNSGRHILETWTENKLDNWIECKANSPPVWKDLGPSDRKIHAAIIIKEGEVNDTTSRLIAYVDSLAGLITLPFQPAGGDFNFKMSIEGFINVVVLERKLGE